MTSQTQLGLTSDEKIILAQKQETHRLYYMLRELMSNQSVILHYLAGQIDIPSFEEFYADLLEGVEQGDEDSIFQLDFYKSNPFITVAGGAPRDWSVNKPARDIDFYILFDRHMFQDERGTKLMYNEDQIRSFKDYLTTFFKKQGLEDITLTCKSKENSAGYNSESGIANVLELKYGDFTFDLIFISSSADTSNSDFTQYVLNTYNFNICKCYYDFKESAVIRSDEAEKDFKDKTITFLAHYRGGHSMANLMNSVFRHYPKLALKFPDFKFNPIVNN